MATLLWNQNKTLMFAAAGGKLANEPGIWYRFVTQGLLALPRIMRFQMQPMQGPRIEDNNQEGLDHDNCGIILKPNY